MSEKCSSNSDITFHVCFRGYELSYFQAAFCLNFYLLSGGEVHSGLWKKHRHKNKNKTNGLGKLGFYTVDGF